MKYITLYQLKKKLGPMKAIWAPVKGNVTLEYENGSELISYSTLIGIKVNSELYLTKYHDYSKTTSKYCTRWSGLTTKERRKLIEEEHITVIRTDTYI